MPYSQPWIPLRGSSMSKNYDYLPRDPKDVPGIFEIIETMPADLKERLLAITNLRNKVLAARWKDRKQIMFYAMIMHHTKMTGLLSLIPTFGVKIDLEYEDLSDRDKYILKENQNTLSLRCGLITIAEELELLFRDLAANGKVSEVYPFVTAEDIQDAKVYPFIARICLEQVKNFGEPLLIPFISSEINYECRAIAHPGFAVNFVRYIPDGNDEARQTRGGQDPVLYDDALLTNVRRASIPNEVSGNGNNNNDACVGDPQDFQVSVPGYKGVWINEYAGRFRG
ncbi:hypothetical protein BTUL_0313g00010 [Botrytis tulipae]|uniref:Uncharacterized protein n=1 Tax=Botrytis tulipae TaxID=87230 RepID=A0A4Z1E553_9HELO|nr:hypothetical protein BTUL_0313g00010 [Botrytis tulipae]